MEAPPAAASAPADSVRSARCPTIDNVWVAVAIVVPVLATLAAPLRTVDLTYHLRMGREILTTAAIPAVDTWTATARGTAWLDQQWLAQVALSWTHRVGGFPALIVARSVLVGAIVAIVFALCRRRGADARTAALATLASFLLAWSHLALRPQLLGALCFAVTLALTLTREAGHRRIWLVPLVTVVWVNSHGSFVLAPAIVGIALVADLRSRGGHAWRLLPALGATVAATLLNPWGPRVWVYVWSLSTNDTIRTTITEWAPSSISTASGAMFLVSLIGIIVWFGLRREPVQPGTLALVGACSLLALVASRNILWWALVVPLMLAGLVPETGTSRSVGRGSPAVNRVLLGVLAAAVLAALPWWRPSTQLVSGLPSNEVLEVVDRAVPHRTRLFVYQPWASWFEFSRPDLEPFVDSRIELFDRSLWDAYDLVIDGSDGWREILTRHGIDAVLVSTRETTLISRLRGDPAWRSIVSDRTAALFVRV